jgi:hypothetical protein
MTNKPLTCQYCGEDVPKPCFDAVGCANIRNKLTPEALAERVTMCFARTQRPGIRVTYAGRGWFHQTSTDMARGHAHKMRRSDVEDSLRRFQDRFAREESERPARKAAAQEEARSRALHLAAEDMLATLQQVTPLLERYLGKGNVPGERELVAQAYAVIAKATTIETTKEGV